ncbi:MAG: DUF3298 domain-containing protein [Clostridia bacterium]|nr:DUF3298 domain-containing protein [Clostridia bacterium]
MKKQVLGLLLCIFMIIVSSGCNKAETNDFTAASAGEEVSAKHSDNQAQKIETVRLVTGVGSISKNIEGENKTLINVTYPVVNLDYRDENKYPELFKALEAFNESEKERQLGFMAEYRDYANETYEYQGESINAVKSIVKPYIRRADSLVTSILCTEYSYLGGYHGDFCYYGNNYNTKTGEIISLSEVVNDYEKFAQAVFEKLSLYWEGIEPDNAQSIEKILREEEAITWTLDYNGITVYFLPYSIASFVVGAPQVTVSYDEYPDIIQEKYKTTPDSYGVQLVKNDSFYYDVTNDGKVDEIVFLAQEIGEGRDIGSVSISINGETYEEESWFYNLNATFIHSKDGNNYIYIEYFREGEYIQTVCYDISNGIKKTGEVDGSICTSYSQYVDNAVTTAVLTNPESFYLGKYTHILSSVNGYKEYRTGDNGVPVTDDKWFRFDEKHVRTLTVLKDFDADVYDENKDKITGKRTLHKGDKVVYVGTDGDKYGLLKCPDGTVCRVEYAFDDETYYITVNGINIDEIFDGVIYGG